MTTQTDTPQDIARVILDQLGVPLRMELGIRDLGYSAEGLYFTLSMNNRRKLRVSVVLAPSDLYTVTWRAMAGRAMFDDPEELGGIYADMLAGLLRDIAAGDTSGWTR